MNERRRIIKAGEARALVGHFQDRSLYEAHRSLVSEASAQAVSEEDRDLVIVGGSKGGIELFGELGKRKRERSRCVPLSEDDFRLLLERGEIELKHEEAPSPTERFDALIGEARAAFDGPPSSEKWTLLVETLDRCHPDDLERLLAYIEPQLNRWDTMTMEKWEPRAGSYMTRFGDPKWGEGLPSDELRVAPPHWLLELFLGEHSAKHRVTRALSFGRGEVSWGMCQRLMASPHLRQVRRLDVGDNPVSGSRRFYEALRTHELMRTVERLALYATSYDFTFAIPGLKGEDHRFESLERLDLSYNWDHHRHTLREMAAYPCFERCETHEHPIEDLRPRMLM